MELNDINFILMIALVVLASFVVVFALARLISALIGGLSRASDFTYILCKPFFFQWNMFWGFFGWLALFAATGWAVSYLVDYFFCIA